MDQRNLPSPVCPIHGKPTKRDTCRECNAACLRRYAEIVRTLCTVVAEFLDAELDGHSCPVCAENARMGGALSTSDEKARQPDQELSLGMIESEFTLTAKQVLLLRRRHGFPRPHRRGPGLLFRRVEVERWVGEQANPSRLADLLRRGPRREARRIRPQL